MRERERGRKRESERVDDRGIVTRRVGPVAHGLLGAAE
jgi:hypothetical protein